MDVGDLSYHRRPCQGPQWCQWPVLPPKAIWMSVVHTAAKGHVSVHGPVETGGRVDGVHVTTEGHIEVHGLCCYLKLWPGCCQRSCCICGLCTMMMSVVLVAAKLMFMVYSATRTSP